MVSFDDVPEVEDEEFLPAGKYTVAIMSSKKKETSKKTGYMLVLRLQVVSGKHKGFSVFHNLNLWNQNTTAVRIAKKEFETIKKAVGVMTPKDSSELHNISFVADVGVREWNGQMQNEITKFLPMSEQTTSEQAADIWG